MIEVNDGPRTLKFDGDEVGFSSSERPGADRWIEFTLFRTSGDRQYVLSRIGVSNVYHAPECRIVANAHGSMPEIPASELESDRIPCSECHPEGQVLPIVFSEQDKTWARVYKTPDAVLSGLFKHDTQGEQYLTAVARRLLEDASQRDPAIAGAYRVQTVT